ncbi:Fe-S cluster assembly ATPase SufC [Candidatus Gracilibacteria bacterium]|nr:Fe-S cluster assembly ATPase SufC [Candidatus Gracilibacteria bacterium]
MIQIQDLYVSAKEKEILKGVSFNFELGKNYCLLGKNGSGKSTLSSVLMGSPKYSVVSGEISIDGSNLLDMSPEQRAGQGIFLSFQNVPEITGIKLSEYLRTIYNISLKNNDSEAKEISPFIFKRFIKKHLEELQIDESFMSRELNVGFSGGEKRKIEILQMKLIGPKYIILDEIDSGLDLDAFRKVCELLRSINSDNNSLIIITHYFKILEYIDVDRVIVLENGNIQREGGGELIEEIKANGFE